MSSDCRNEAAIKSFLMPKIKIIADTILQHILEQNADVIDSIVYNKYNPKLYNRTHEFRDKAWEITEAKIQDDTASGEFKYAPWKMNYNPEFGQHGTPFHAINYWGVEGQDAREYLADIIYNGVSRGLFVGEWSNSRDAWGELVKKIGSKRLKAWVQEGAQEAGLDIQWHKLPRMKVSRKRK